MQPLPPEQPGRVYSYAAEIAALMQGLNDLPPYVPYTVMSEGIPCLESYLKNEAAPTPQKAHCG